MSSNFSLSNSLRYTTYASAAAHVISHHPKIANHPVVRHLKNASLAACGISFAALLYLECVRRDVEPLTNPVVETKPVQTPPINPPQIFAIHATFNQFNMPQTKNELRNSCTVMAGEGLLQMLQGKLRTTADLDNVMQSAAQRYRAIQAGLQRAHLHLTSDRGMISWDECFGLESCGFWTSLKTQVFNSVPRHTEIKISPGADNTPAFVEHLQKLAQTARLTNASQGWVLTMSGSSFAVSVSPQGLFQFFDSHGDNFTGTVCPGGDPAVLAQFRDPRHLAEHLNKKQASLAQGHCVYYPCSLLSPETYCPSYQAQ